MHIIAWPIKELKVQVKLWNLPSCTGLLLKALQGLGK